MRKGQALRKFCTKRSRSLSHFSATSEIRQNNVENSNKVDLDLAKASPVVVQRCGVDVAENVPSRTF